MKTIQTKIGLDALLLGALLVGSLVMVFLTGARPYLARSAQPRGTPSAGVGAMAAPSVSTSAAGPELLDTFDRATAAFNSGPLQATDLSDRHSADELARLLGWAQPPQEATDLSDRHIPGELARLLGWSLK